MELMLGALRNTHTHQSVSEECVLRPERKRGGAGAGPEVWSC